MIPGVVSGEELDWYADPAKAQYFLVSPEKLALLFDAAGIRPTDRVLEVGSGAGTVAASIPECARLTLIELDGRLMAPLKRNAPTGAQIIQGDALELVHEIPFDVLLANLPTSVTERLLAVLPQLSFRTAVLAVGESTPLQDLAGGISWSEVAKISGPDFRPPQPSVSRLVKIQAAPDAPESAPL